MEQASGPRLKRLEIQGFKSFAPRTVFEIGGGITALVGPNGSGKSNVADAFRWILGEQGSRTLRVRKPEDVIFAGGGRRGPAGFAEVSVVLDNADGRLPLDFAEIVVTRRLHRSGESEYLINRRRVRLRDLVELFLAARLGQNSYAILGQGMVDAVLSLRPEERRGLIEEAADVRRFRLRIDEATSQLADTNVNRDRAELLLGEIAPRLGQLERQAKRAGEYSRLSNRLAERLRSLYARRWRAAAERTSAAREAFDGGEAALGVAAAGLHSDEQRLKALRRRLAEAQSALQSAETEGAALRERLRESQRRLQQLQERQRLTDQRRAETEADVAELLGEAAAINAEEPEADAVSEGPRAAAEAAAGLRAEVEALLGPMHDAQARLQSAESEQHRLEREASEAVERHLGLVRERRRVEQEAMRLAQRRKDALKRLAAWAADYCETSRAARTIDSRLPAAQRELADLTRQAQAAGAARDVCERELAEIDQNLDGVRRRLEQLEHLRESHRPAEERLRTLLDALRGVGPGRPRLLGVLGGLIRVERGLEVAIEAALAGALDAVVVRSSAEALNAVRSLQEIETGRLSFYALDAIRGGRVLNLNSETGIVGVASGFVRCDDAYRELVDALLGKVIVVGDLEAAERVSRRGLGAAVTLDGVLLASGGLVSGGRARTDGYVFRAASELEELRPEVVSLEARRAAATRVFAEARLQAREAAERAQRARGTHDDLVARRAAAEPAIARLRRRLGPLRGELEWVRAAAAEVSGSRDSMEPAEERLRRGAERARAAADAHAAGALADALTDRDRLVGRRTQLVAELDDACSALRTREREREALTALRESRRAARERTERLLALRHQRLVELATERERLRREITDAETLVAAERDAFAAWPGQIEPLRSALQPLLAGDAELTGRIASRARELTNRERGRLEAELALRRAEQEQALAEEALEREAGITPGEAEGIVGPEEGTPAPEQLEKQVRDLRTRIRGLGAVNAEAEADYHETSARYHFLAGQIADLKQAEASLVAAIEELRGIMRERFDAAFASINAGFERYFRGFFGGGQARLVLTDPGSGGEAGVEIAAQPPGKRLQNLTMLSGGERSMTSVALLFALLENHAAPFCVLDEVDAALDEANVARVGSSLTELARSSQFLVITHNRGTLQAANQIYGVSMNDDGISTVLSMRFDDAAPLLA